MVFRTVFLFLFFAVTGHCQTQSKGEASVPEASAAASAVTEAVVAVDSVNVAKDDVATADNQLGDFLAAEKPTANPLFGDQQLAQIHSVESQAAENPNVDAPARDVVAAQEQRTDGPAEATESHNEGAANQGQTSSKEESNEIRPVNQSHDRLLKHKYNGSWSLNSIRNSLQTVRRYFDFVMELLGGHNGGCEYHCKYGDTPEPRPGYQIPEPNGCSSSSAGFQLDLGIPAMTNCCNQLDVCYDTCGSDKYNCDSTFLSCLQSICSDLKESLGFVSKVQACESMADALYNTVWTLGCRPYMNSQRAACVCKGEDRDEL